MFTYKIKSVIFRYNNDGSLDQSFGNNGIYIDADPEVNQISHISELPSGKILITGDKLTLGPDPVFMMQLNNDGTRNKDFGDSGLALFQHPDTLFTIENYSTSVQSDSKVLISGKLLNYEEGTSDFVILRFLEDGTLDESFGEEGYFILDRGVYDELHHISLQQDGKIIFTGATYVVEDNGEFTSILIAARLEQDGTLDLGFGQNGINNFEEFSDLTSVGYQIKENSDSDIIISGSVYTGEDEADIFFVRLDNTGELDESLGDGGIYIDDFEGYFDNVYGMKFDSENRIVVYGESINFGGPSRGFIARYIPDLNLGKVDFETLKANVFTYPNPVGSECTLEYELLKDERISIDLLNSNGALIKRITPDNIRTAGKNAQLINMDGLAPGMYIIALNSGNNRINTKIIKQ